jgi:hypothetical protein
VHVQPAALVDVEDALAQDAHVPGAHQDVDLPLPEDVEDRLVEVVPLGVVGRVDHFTRDPRRPSSLEGPDPGSIGEHELQVGADRRVVDQRLQVGTRPGDQHRDPIAHGGGHATRRLEVAEPGR